MIFIAKIHNKEPKTYLFLRLSLDNCWISWQNLAKIECLYLQCDKWSDNPDQFVEDEDEDSFTYSVRISSQDLLMVSK